jgi:hypothetical protein
MGVRQGQEITVGDLGGMHQTSRVDTAGIHEADIVGPKPMPRKYSHAGQTSSDRRRCSRGIRVSGMAHDAQQAVLSHRAGSPGSVPLVRKPLMRRLMLNMRRVHERYEHVYIE